MRGDIQQYKIEQSPRLTNEKFIGQLEQILNKTIKGFELSPVKDAFANAFLSKNNKSSPELANRINEWIGKNGWSGVNFRYDSTYKTINYILQENAKKDLNIRKKYFGLFLFL